LKIRRGEELLEPYVDLWTQALQESVASKKIDLTLWPETSCPDDWMSRFDTRGERRMFLLGTAGGESDLERSLRRRGLSLNTLGNVLLGLNTLEEEENGQFWKYNSAVYLRNRSYAGRYDKMHLVPFGEYVPLRQWFPWLQMFTPYRNDYSCKPGEQLTRFPLKANDRDYTFAVIICYEDSEPFLARQYVRPGQKQPVDFFVNISNDGWFRGTEEHEQHLAICRFRAVETRRSVVRAVNMGISGIIDPHGRVIALPGKSWAESKAMSGIVVGEVPISGQGSLYAEWGDWLPLLCWGGLAVLLILRPFRKVES
jgi:apolipoprotein N-acyltransferase